MNIRNNTILITGGSSGIGRALAIKLNQLGNKVIVCGRNKLKLEDLTRKEPAIKAYVCDLSNDIQLKNLISKIKKNHQDLNILINNAGILNNEAITNPNFISNSILELKVNLQTPIILINSLLPILKTKKHSAIINIGSLVSYAPLKSKPTYCASKAGLHSFTKSLRYQLKNTNIQVIEVFPPAVNTEMAKHLGDSAKFRILTPEYVSAQIIKGLNKNKKEIRIGITKLFYWLYRFFPELVELKMQRS